MQTSKRTMIRTGTHQKKQNRHTTEETEKTNSEDQKNYTIIRRSTPLSEETLPRLLRHCGAGGGDEERPADYSLL
jgi:hypothetical protein